MAVTIGQQPYKTLRDAIHAQPGLIAMLAKDGDDPNEGDPWAVFNQSPDSDDRFPKLIWESLGVGGDIDMDVERHLKRDDSLQFSIWTSDPEAVYDIAAAVDPLEEYWLGGSMDSEHWVCRGINKTSRWQRIEWNGNLIEGMTLYQYVSDWRYRYNRRQNVD